jgi:DNA-binding NtrC family response regulator
VSPERGKLLLVEDDPAIRTALLDALQHAGFQALGAGDAAGALAVLARHRVTVVVADYHLPGITGLDLLAAIRVATPATPLILYSGGMTSELVAEAHKFGVRAVLEKPVSAERLIAAIRSS